MSDPSQQPTEEELRAYLAQLRDADPAEILAQAYTVLGTGAEVKLGRHDARLLIDAMSALVEAAAERIGADLATRMRDGVRQLQLAQVEAERQVAGQPRPEGEAAQAEQPAAQQRAAQQPNQQMTDRLWIPGRDPGPPRR